MDIHLHDWRTKLIFCKDLCAIFTTIKLTFHMGIFRWKWLFEESDWASWIAQNETTGREKHEITPQSKTKQSDKCTVIQMTVGATPPTLSASTYMSSKTVIGPMLDVEQALCPHHEVKFTFMKLKSQVGFLCWYGFKRHYCSALLPATSCALKLPKRNGMLGKHHYCALTWSTVNGWVKVPFEMHDIK